MKQAAYDLRYLAACAVNRITPDKQTVEAMNLENLHKMSKAHSLSALTATAIASAGMALPPEWKAEKERAVRRNILFDGERARILAFFEQNGIW